MFKFLHTADIHLDSPLLNLAKYDGAPEERFRAATREAFDNLVELAVEESVRFILIAGDLYDGECRDSATPLHFRRQMHRLNEHGIQVFMIQGNHDACAKKAFAFDLPENVKLFATKKPETVFIEDLQVAIHGQGFSSREVFDNLSDKYPPPQPGFLNIGMLHTSCGHHDQHTSYAPSTVRGLTDKGYDYWALGHIHKREVLTGPNPWIVYSGNTQGRHIRETGSKSCEIVLVEQGEIKRVQNRFIDVVRWHLANVDTHDCQSVEEVIDRIETEISTAIHQADNRPLAVRLEIVGSTKAHYDFHRHADHWDRQIRDEIINRFDDQVWLEKIKFKTSPPRESCAHENESCNQLISSLTDLESIESACNEVRNEIEQVLKLIPTDPRMDEEHFDFDESNHRKLIAADVRELLVSRLLDPEVLL